MQEQKNLKVLNAVTIICAISAIILGIMQISSTYKNVGDLLMLILGISTVTQSIRYWKSDRHTAIISLCIAIFLFLASIYIFINR